MCSSSWKHAGLIAAITCAAIFLGPLPITQLSNAVQLSDMVIKSIANAKQILFACKEYAADNNGRYPDSLDDLFPAYLPDRSILVSPLKPGEPLGYLYKPGLTEASPPDTVVLEDKFAPAAKHERVVVYVDNRARVLKLP